MTRTFSNKLLRNAKLLPASFFLFCVVIGTDVVSASGILSNGDFTQVDEKGFPDNWQLKVFSPLHPSVATEEGRKNISFTFNEDGRQQFSFFQRLDLDSIPLFDQNGDLGVTFSYKAEMADRGSVSVAFSGDPGCNLPCLRNRPVINRDGKWHQATSRFSLTGLAAKKMVLEYVIEGEFKAIDKFTISEVQAKIVSIPIAQFNPTNPISGVLFTDAASQKVSGLLKVAKTYVGCQAHISLTSVPSDKEKPLATQDVTVSYPVTHWEFDMTSVPEGKYTLSAELHGKENKAVAEKKIVIWKLKPTDTTSRIINGNVYYGGKPIILLGTYHVSDWAVGAANHENQRIGATPLTRQQMLAGLAGQGFNSFCFTNGVPKTDFLDDALKSHLFVIPSIGGCGRDWGGAPLVEQIASAKDAPSILGWYGVDEAVPGESTKQAVEVYYDLKNISPHKLVVASFFAVYYLEPFNGEATSADLILVDTYRITSSDADLSEVGTEIRDAVAYAKKHGNIAIGVVPQAFVFFGPEPTQEQLRAQFYLGIVNGARAFFPYSYIEDYHDKPFTQYTGAPSGMSLNPKRTRWFLPDSKVWLAIPEIFKEIKTLEDFILDDGEAINVTSYNKSIQFMAKKVGKESCLIAVNPKATPQKTTFSFSASIKVTPLFNTSPTESQGGNLPLEFKGYEVKVFHLGKQ